MIEISLTSLVAGTKYRGEFEERLEAVVRAASQCGAVRSLGEEREPKPILFIDEIHLLLGAGSASDFRLPDKALDWVDQACAQVRFATLSPQKRRDRLSLPRAGTGSPSHHLVVGRDGIAAAVAAREILSG